MFADVIALFDRNFEEEKIVFEDSALTKDENNEYA